MKKRCIPFCLVLLLCFAPKAYCDHVRGGDITWQYLGNNKYKFVMHLYRDCKGTLGYPTSGVFITTNIPGHTSIPLNYPKIDDITAQCDFVTGGPQPLNNCGPVENQGVLMGQGTIERFIYESNPIDLSGVKAPGSNGYLLTYSPPCCRNAPVNISCSNTVLRSKMFRYRVPGSATYSDLTEYHDSSPDFSESPLSLIIENPDETYVYNSNAFDPDNDSLKYEFDYPWDAVNVNCTFTGGYSMSQPIPDLVGLNPNPVNGEITFHPSEQGKYATCIKVTSYKCGQKVSEIYRDFQTEVAAQPPGYVPNFPPDLTSPFYAHTKFDTTIYAGETLKFKVTASDSDQLSFNLGLQKVELLFGSTQFGTNFTDPNGGCPNPPCATLDSTPGNPGTYPPKPYYNNGDLIGYGYRGTGSASAWITWKTDCNNLVENDCGKKAISFVFIVKARDNACPAPAQLTKSIKVRVLPTPLLPSPVIRCVSVLPNGDVQLTWSKPTGPEVSFKSYLLYASTSPNGTFEVLDSILNFNTLTTIHKGAGAQQKTWYYKIYCRSSCFGDISDKLSDLKWVRSINPIADFDSTANLAHVTWTAISSPVISSSSKKYTLYRQYPKGTGWSIVTTIDSGNDSISFNDTNFVSGCSDSVFYKIEIADSSGCTSVSAIGSTLIQAKNSLNTSFSDNIACEGDQSILISSVQGGIPPHQFQWFYKGNQIGSSDSILKYTFTGSDSYTVTLRITDSKGCEGNYESTVTNYRLKVKIDADQICGTNSSSLKASITGGSGNYTYEWNPYIGSDAGPFTISAPLGSTTKYRVKVSDVDKGCTSIDSITIVSGFGVQPVFPTAFSPNNDGANDEFRITGDCIETCQLQIFDRWGAKVFESTNPDEKWNGKKNNIGEQVQTGVYAYVAKVQTLDGLSYSFSGTIVLTR